MTDKEQLVEFGNYLFSEERAKLLKEGGNMALNKEIVSDADLENFLAKYPELKKFKEKDKADKELNPSEQIEKLINNYKSVENPAENILVTIQYLEGAKKEIERPILEIEVIAKQVVVSDLIKGDTFNLDEMTEEEIIGFCELNNIPLTATEKEAMLDEVEKFLLKDETPE